MKIEYNREMFLKAQPDKEAQLDNVPENTKSMKNTNNFSKKGKKGRNRNKHNNLTPDLMTANEVPVNVAGSQILDKISVVIDDNAATTDKDQDEVRNNDSTLNISSNWVTESEESSDEGRSFRRRRMKFRFDEDNMNLEIMRKIFDAQSDEVKQIVVDLHKLITKQKRSRRNKTFFRSNFFMKKLPNQNKNQNKKDNKVSKNINPGTTGFFTMNIKMLARQQRRRRYQRKRRSQNKRKKFPRRKRRCNAKKGNRQGRKRYLRAQRLFDKGVFLVGRKLLNEVWEAVKDPNATATSFCNNNTHGLSKIHKKQIELYERIEEDLQRLDKARQERFEAALERKSKANEKETLRSDFKNKIEARNEARAEREELRKERRATRKQRALEKKMRIEKAKLDELSYLKKGINVISC